MTMEEEKMASPILSLLGQAKEIHTLGTPSSIFLRDPFCATSHDFIIYCLNEVSKALHLAVVHTYHQLPKKRWAYFYLVGYRPRSRWSNVQEKMYDDPSVCTQGKEIKWLLKNLRWYWRKYAEYMELYDEAFDDITGFLLFDVVQSAFADCETEIRSSLDEDLVQDCFEASLDLVIAICEGKYYEAISEDVRKYRENLEMMLPVVSEFRTYQCKQRETHRDSLDTSKVIDFLKSDKLMQQLEKEHHLGSNPNEKPLTNFFIYTVMPRFEQLSPINDSGIETGSNEINVPYDPIVNIPFEPVVNIPLDPLMNITLDSSILNFPFQESMVNVAMEESIVNIPMSPIRNISLASIPNISLDSIVNIPVDPFLNQSMDGSMIVINNYERTPVAKHRVVQRLQGIGELVIASTPGEEKPSSDDDVHDQSDICEGSFVLI